MPKPKKLTKEQLATGQKIHKLLPKEYKKEHLKNIEAANAEQKLGRYVLKMSELIAKYGSQGGGASQEVSYRAFSL